MKVYYIFLIALVFLFYACENKPQKANITIYCTTDLHGAILNYDLKNNKEAKGSLANAATILKEARNNNTDNIILLDGGDILQGQPSIYYYNFIDTTSEHIQAKVMNYLKYDAAAVGNHDIEAGHTVYDRVNKEFNFPWITANLINTKTGKPYFKPYTIVEKEGIKIAILGLTTPNIPQWLPEVLWEGIEFEDMVECAQKWVPLIHEREKPDLLIGLFHSGYDYSYGGNDENTYKNENATKLVAEKVAGIDIIVYGHDHYEKIEHINNDNGVDVVLVNPKARGEYLGKIDVFFEKYKGKYNKTITSELIALNRIPQDKDYNDTFAKELAVTKEYVNTEIGVFKNSLTGVDALFGPSVFTDFIHEVQLSMTGADISLASVLSPNAIIKEGAITIRDMFNLYSYENSLYTMELSGKEVLGYLEYAAALQYNTMKNENDHLLKFKKNQNGDYLTDEKGRMVLESHSYNYSSAAGIKYIVDVSKKDGEKVKIFSMSDGKEFDENKIYKVALNSYQGNGGGGHLINGAGLSKEELNSRIVNVKNKDIRYYIIRFIQEKKVLDPQCRNNWKVIPETWFVKGKNKDLKQVVSNNIH